jgi:flagellar protein FlaJ
MGYAFVSRILPGRVREGYKNLLSYTGISMHPERFIGFMFLFGFGVAFAIAFDAMMLLGFTTHTTLIIFALTYVVFEILVYMWVWFSAESKGRFVDGILPDALQLMSMNIRAGMTPDRALLLSARPEFGAFEQEISRAGKEILAGKDVGTALTGISKRIKSRLVDRTVNLIVEGMKSGGELADLLEQTASDIQSSKLVEKEVRANVLMYVIFIFFAAGIGAPLVFGISTHLVETLTEHMGRYQTAEFATAPAAAGVTPFGSFEAFQGIAKITVDPNFLIMYAAICLTVTSIFGGLIIGLIKDGKEKQGVKYIPALLAISLVLFLVTRIIISSIFAF